jgi:hypothetical protein
LAGAAGGLVRFRLVASIRLPGVPRALCALIACFVIALSCSHPDYRFVPDANVSHCGNRALDSDLGESDLDCGGPDCHGCVLGQHCNDSSDCTASACIDSVCQEPGCENHALDGEETGIDCGGDCEPCRDGQPCLVARGCESGVCASGVCVAPRCDDGVRNGSELDSDCGGSFCDGCPLDSPCQLPADCESSLCDPDTWRCELNCARGTDECDLVREDPCETNLLTSPRNCGVCGNACELPHAIPACGGGMCQIEACTAPWARCNTLVADGCEINLSTDPMNCGGCGMVCPALNGTARCTGASCGIDCEVGFDDCDTFAGNGCESPVNDDVNNCGACKHACPFEEGETPNCVRGECGVTRCEDGLGDCDADGECETDLTDDVDHCGRCGGPCNVSRGTAACEDGQCVVVECEADWRNCDVAEDGGVADGCETNVRADPENCGSCGEDCTVAQGAGTCENGKCAVVSCATGFANCDPEANDGGFSTGCETDTRSAADHCGGCGNECEIPNAIAACVNSNCVIADCQNDFADCNAAAGCETDTSSSVQHCGSCTGKCSNAGATRVSCTDGACDAPVCDGTHRSCDGDNSTGCETDITTPAHCGGCGIVCDAQTPHCVPTNGTFRCQAQIALLNTPPYPTLQAVGNSMSFGLTPHAGSNRLILLAIASESQGNGIAGARPDAVTFGNAAMTAGPEQVGHSDYWSTDHFIYYANEAVISSRTSQQTLTINGSGAPAITGMVAQWVQLNGVRQDAPISAFRGGFLGTTTPEAPDPSVIGLTIPVATSGSIIYSFASAMWMDGKSCPAGMPTTGCPSWSITPATNLTLLNTVSTSPHTVGGSTMRAFGLYVNAPSPHLPTAGSYTPTWSIPFTGRMTHMAIVVAPAQQ